MGKTNFDDLELGDRSIEAREIGSESAADGQVLTADGSGGAAWEDVAGAVRMVGTALIGGDFGGNARGGNAVDLQTGRGSVGYVAKGEQSVAIGYNVGAYGDHTVAIGSGAYALDDVVAIGKNARSFHSRAVVIGVDVEGYSDSVTIGAGASGFQNSVAIGSGATSPHSSVAVGKGAQSASKSVVIGENAQQMGYAGAVVIGAGAISEQYFGVAIGYLARVRGNAGVAIGYAVDNPTANSVKIGWNNTNGFAHFTTFTPSAVGGAATHELPVNLGGTVYRILLRA